MSFKEFLEKLVGARCCCSCGCCGGEKPFKDSGGFELDRILAARLIVSSLLFAAALIGKKIPEPWPLIMLIISSLVSGYDIIAASVLSVMKQDYFDKCILILVASVLAFAVGQSKEGTSLILIFQLSGVLIDYAFTRTSLNVSDAVISEAESAHIITSGAEDIVPASSVNPGDNVIIYPGERIPFDCIILDGSGSIDISPLGGGEEPVFAAEGDEILSGCANINGTLRCEATASQSDSAAAALARAVKSAADAGSPVPKAVRRFLELYTPVLVIITVLITGILPLVFKIGILYAIRRAIVFLVISNPCAMVVALPLIRFCGSGRAAKNGILFSGNSVMEKAAHTVAVIFDKAGTLTDGSPSVASIKSKRLDADTLLKITAHALAYSESAVARSVIASYGGTIYIELIDKFTEIPNKGVEVYVDSVRICAGNIDLMTEKSIVIPTEDISDNLAVYVSIANEYAGRILLADGLREDASDGVSDLAKQGIDTVVMLTDENSVAAAKTASELKIREYYSGYGIKQKLAEIGEIKHTIPENGTLMFVSDKKSLGREHTAADVDISMCDIQALTTQSFSDIMILNGKVSGIASAIAAAKYSETFSMLTIVSVLFVKLVILVLAFFGIATLWFSVFIDSAAALGAILCSILVFNSDPSSGLKINLLRR